MSLSQSIRLLLFLLLSILDVVDIILQVSVRYRLRLRPNAVRYTPWPPGQGLHYLSSVPKSIKTTASTVLIVTAALALFSVSLACAKGISRYHNVHR